MEQAHILTIQDLSVEVDGKPILQGVNLIIRSGEVHAVMGPNGSGKSTLANTIMGHPKYKVTGGKMLFDGEDMTNLKPDKRAKLGVFLAFQYPKEIPGVTLTAFLKTAVNAIRKARNQEAVELMEFRKKLREKLHLLKLDSAFLNRAVNDGFSGGEKKKVEILQMALLSPFIAVLDETDSGLDVDALKTVALGINRLISPELGVLLITHYQRILHYIQPQFVHVMMDGKIVTSGGKELADRLEREGYEWLHDMSATLPVVVIK